MSNENIFDFMTYR